MRKKHLKLSLLILIAFVFLLQPNIGAKENLHRIWAVRDCRIVTVSSPPVEKGNLVIRDGLIEDFGARISIPQDAEIIDGTNITVYPGLIDALNQDLLKLPEEKFDRSKYYSGEFTDKDRGITPELSVYDYLNLGKSSLEKYHKFGVTAVQVLPQRGIFPGRSSVFSLNSTDRSKALLLKDKYLGIGFSPGVFMTYPNSLMGVVAFLRQELSDAGYFDMRMKRWEKNPRGISRPLFNKKLSLLSEYATGRKPVIFLCRNQHDIRRALQLGSEFKLNYLICDLGNEAFKVIPELKKAKAKVICALTFKVPATSLQAQRGRQEREKAEKELYIKNPARIAEAGIQFAFSSIGLDDPKSFVEAVQKAVENGLPRDTALKALTLNAASFLDLDKALGSIEIGKIANLVLVENDLLTKEAKVRYVFADGIKFEIKEAKIKEGEKPTVNVSGKWELSVESGGGTIKLTVDFTQEESSLSGKITSPFGVFDFTGGTVVGNEIYFEMSISVGGQEMDLFFSATVEGDTMRGTVVQGTMGSAEFTGKRIP